MLFVNSVLLSFYNPVISVWGRVTGINPRGQMALTIVLSTRLIAKRGAVYLGDDNYPIR